MRRLGVTLALVGLAFFSARCDSAAPANEPDDFVKGGWDGKADASVLATILDFEFDGELLSDWSSRQVIQDQLLYTIGHLNEERSVGRLDRLELTNVKNTTEGGKTKITYHAKMPVAWASKTDLPTSYEFTLPRDVTSAGQEAFTAKYNPACVEWGAHDVDTGSMWYYFRPGKSGCTLAATDVVKTTAKVTVSTVNSTGKYPEYHKVWEDNALKIVSIFGKYEDGATTASDAGIAAFNEFVASMKRTLAPFNPTTVPATIPDSPGVSTPDISFKGTLPGGKTIEVTALLVDNIGSTTAEFDTRYNALSTHADLIAYNGHAGLGQNVRALAQKGSWTVGQYVIVFMNGCDTYAYVDGSLAQTRARINADDPTGTKYMEFVVNAMPAYFANDSEATSAIINGLLKFDAPMTYEEIFKSIDTSQVVLVTGDNDNVYFPGYPGGVTPPATWAGITESGTVAKNAEKRWETPTLKAGKYKVAITGSGDADLYVRTGEAPTLTKYDCRPYRTSSNETCLVTLNADAPVHIMVQGYATSSTYKLVAAAQP
ncbi:MAG TPA: PPC domain-containing protein [Polyangia bacterium]